MAFISFNVSSVASGLISVDVTVSGMGVDFTQVSQQTFTFTGAGGGAGYSFVPINAFSGTLSFNPGATVVGATVTFTHTASGATAQLAYGTFPAVDPYSRIYNGVFAVLANYAPWAAAFRKGDRIDFADGSGSGNTLVNGSKGGTMKQSMAPADFPEFMLLEHRGVPNPWGNAKTIDFSLTLFACVSVDRLDLVSLNRAIWLTMTPLIRTGGAIGMPGLVRSWRPSDSRIADDDGRLSRGSKRFTFTTAIDVLGYVTRDEMIHW